MFNKASLATEFADVLSFYAKAKNHVAQRELELIYKIFPWLSNFHIEQDGDLRWLARNDLLTDGDIVFSRPSAAQRQVRDWVIEYVDGQRADAANEE